MCVCVCVCVCVWCVCSDVFGSGEEGIVFQETTLCWAHNLPMHATCHKSCTVLWAMQPIKPGLFSRCLTGLLYFCQATLLLSSCDDATPSVSMHCDAMHIIQFTSWKPHRLSALMLLVLFEDSGSKTPATPFWYSYSRRHNFAATKARHAYHVTSVCSKKWFICSCTVV